MLRSFVRSTSFRRLPTHNLLKYFSYSTLKSPVTVLCILDGWGHREELTDNAVQLAQTSTYNRLWEESSRSLLSASEEDVGLPSGQFGNSEVGHMNIGSGRVVYQDLVMIDKSIREKTLETNETLLAHIQSLKASKGSCHLMGLVSPGGVHAHQDHIAALSRIISSHGVPVIIHVFTDGRDTAPQDAINSINRFVKELSCLSLVSIGTIHGRYYAMDRDKRWERVEKAYKVITEPTGSPAAADALTAIKASYATNVFDEFILPTVLEGYSGVKDGDGLLFANFRADRARQILSAFVDPKFAHFPVRQIQWAHKAGMVEYSSQHAKWLGALFPPKDLSGVLGEVVAQQGHKQLRIAETEKYPHVTFFFNGGKEAPFPLEDRILVPSPKVATYDLQPEMSATELTDKLCAAIDSKQYPLIVVNYANGDMVGHSGSLSAAIQAVKAVDQCLSRVESSVSRADGVLLITADHGNCELMHDHDNGQPHTAHTLSPVPFLVADHRTTITRPKQLASQLSDGKLSDVAPTVFGAHGDRTTERNDGQEFVAICISAFN